MATISLSGTHSARSTEALTPCPISSYSVQNSGPIGYFFFSISLKSQQLTDPKTLNLRLRDRKRSSRHGGTCRQRRERRYFGRQKKSQIQCRKREGHEDDDDDEKRIDEEEAEFLLSRDRKKEREGVCIRSPATCYGGAFVVCCCFPFFSFSFLFGFAVFRHGVRRFGGPFYGFLCYKEKKGNVTCTWLLVTGKSAKKIVV